MTFDAARLDAARMARVPFADAWRALPDPADAGAFDPGSVTDRLGLYRLLIERGNPGDALGAHDERSPLWGYASQLAWQHRSGRLGDGGDRIAPASWWGACNYALCVVPYLAAAELGVVPRLRGPAAPAWYEAALPRWRDALALLVAARPGDDLEPARLAIWGAHVDSIDRAVRAHAAEFATLPPTEQRFARGWVRMVELFGAAAWPTDLVELTADEPAALPGRVLADDAAVAALPAAERRTARMVIGLGDRPGWRWRVDVAGWRVMMRSRGARDDAALILRGLLGRGRGAWPGRARAVRAVLGR
jgi:hypothetical protein